MIDQINGARLDNCSSTIAPALFYYLPSMAECVALGLRSRLDSTGSIHVTVITYDLVTFDQTDDLITVSNRLKIRSSLSL